MRCDILGSVMKRTVLMGLLALVLIGGGCFANSSTDQPTEIDRDAILFEARENGLIMSEDEVEAMRTTGVIEMPATSTLDVEEALNQDFTGWSSAALADVTGGGSFGLAYTQYVDGTYTLVAKLGGLPEPAQGYFYEGWVVRRGDTPSVVSTGPAVVSGVWYGNVFSTTTDLSDHDFYVLTLEPDDGDPAPAEHILEGVIN